jgi:hypothetical protein
LLAVVLLAVPAGASGALTKAAANARAISLLAPSREAGQVVVFGLPRPLSAEQTVFQAISGAAINGKRPKVIAERRLGQKAWLFWEDLAYGARFEHPSVLLLISARNGRVLRRENYAWWPLIGGHEPSFMGAGYLSSRYKVYPSPAAHTAVSHDSPHASPDAFGASLAQPWYRDLTSTDGNATAHASDALSLPPNAFKGDCLIVMGLTRDKQFKQDFEGMANAAAELRPYGLQGPFAPQPVVNNGFIVEDPSGAALQKTVTDAITKRDCEDIMIYLDGHGYPAAGTNMPDGKPVTPQQASPHAQVLVGYKYTPAGVNDKGEPLVRSNARTVTSEDLKAILRAHPTTGFKFKIDACFSGRFVDEIPRQDYPNMLVLETAANDREYSYSYVPQAWMKNGSEVAAETPGSTHFVNTTNNPGNTNAQHLGRGEFTNGNLAGISHFTHSKTEIDTALGQGGSLFAHMLVDAFTDGAGQDFAATIGLQHPELVSNVPGAQTSGPAPSPPVVNGGPAGGAGPGTGGPPPTASFDFSPNSPPHAPKTSQSVSFDGSSSSGPGAINTWLWSFGSPLYGGGSPASPTASGGHVTMSFGGPGVYPVTLTVTDITGDSNSVTQNVYVSGAGTKNATLTDIPCSKAVATGGYVDINIPSFAENPKAKLTVTFSGCSGKTIKIVKEEFVSGAVNPEDGGSKIDEWNREKNHIHIEFVLEGTDSSGEGSATFTASWE